MLYLRNLGWEKFYFLNKKNISNSIQDIIYSIFNKKLTELSLDY